MGRASEGEQRACVEEGWDGITAFEECLEPAHSLFRVAEDPQLLERNEKLETEFDLVRFERPRKRGSEVRCFGDCDLRPLLTRDVCIERRAQCDVAVVLRMPGPDCVNVRELLEPLERELA